jgi:hypothetical protein
METKIEKGIPIPLRKGKWKSLLASMDIGDSFHCDKEASQIRPIVTVTAKRLGIKVVVRKNENVCGVRVWRVE